MSTLNYTTWIQSLGVSSVGAIVTPEIDVTVLNVTGDASIGGNLAVTGGVTGGAASFDSLAVTNNATVGGTLGVTGVTTAGVINSGNHAVTGTLSSSGAATLNSLGVTNNATVGGTLGVTGTSTLAAVNSGPLAVTGTITGSTTAAIGNFRISDMGFGGTTTGWAVVGNDNGTGYSFLAQPLATYVNSPTGGAVRLLINNVAVAVFTAGASALTGTLSTSGAATLNSLVVTNGASVGGLATLTGGLTTPANVTTTGTGQLVVAGNGTIGGTLGVTGVTTAGVINSGNHAITGTLAVSGLSTLTGGLTTPANVTTTGTGQLVVAGNGTIGGTLGVTGVTTAGVINSGNHGITGTLAVSGLSTLTGGLTTPANVTTTGTGQLVVAGNATIGGTLGVTGVTTTGTTNTGNLSVTGTLSTSSTATVNSLVVTNSATVNGELIGAGMTATNGFRIVAQPVANAWALIHNLAPSNQTIRYAMGQDTSLNTYVNAYSSSSVFVRNSNVNVAQFATAGTTLTGTLAVSGLSTLTGGLTTPANLTTTGTGQLVVAGNATIGGTLGVTGTATFATLGITNLTVSGTANVSGLLTATSAGAGTVNRIGNMQIGDFGYGTNVTGMCYNGNNTTTGYCILQDSSGSTYINCKTGFNTTIRVNHVVQATIDVNGLTATNLYSAGVMNCNGSCSVAGGITGFGTGFGVNLPNGGLRWNGQTQSTGTDINFFNSSAVLLASINTTNFDVRTDQYNFNNASTGTTMYIRPGQKAFVATVGFVTYQAPSIHYFMSSIECDNTLVYKPGGGSWTASSDRRVKRDIKPFQDGLDAVAKIKPVWYKYNGKGGTHDDDRQQIGVIAQDIQKVCPYTVGSRTDVIDDKKTDVLTYDSSALVYLLVNAVTELKQRVESLERDLAGVRR